MTDTADNDRTVPDAAEQPAVPTAVPTTVHTESYERRVLVVTRPTASAVDRINLADGDKARIEVNSGGVLIASNREPNDADADLRVYATGFWGHTEIRTETVEPHVTAGLTQEGAEALKALTDRRQRSVRGDKDTIVNDALVAYLATITDAERDSGVDGDPFAYREPVMVLVLPDYDVRSTLSHLASSTGKSPSQVIADGITALDQQRSYVDRNRD